MICVEFVEVASVGEIVVGASQGESLLVELFLQLLDFALELVTVDHVLVLQVLVLFLQLVQVLLQQI